MSFTALLNSIPIRKRTRHQSMFPCAEKLGGNTMAKMKVKRESKERSSGEQLEGEEAATPQGLNGLLEKYFPDCWAERHKVFLTF